MKILLLLLSLLLFSTRIANAGLFGPSTYEECRDKYVPVVKTDIGATTAIFACSYRHSGKAIKGFKKGYYDCLLKKAAPCETKSAVILMINKCKTEFSE